MQTINEYLYRAKVLEIEGNNLSLEMDCGFYLFHKEQVQILQANRGDAIGLQVGTNYFFKSIKTEALVRNSFQNTDSYNVQLIKQIPKNYYYKAVGISCHDGDTFKAEIDIGFHNKIIMDIRLQGINTPEISTGEPGRISKLFLSEKVVGKQIVLETFKINSQFEKYGRFLALVYELDKFVPNATTNSINSELLRAKLAIPMSY
jgi:endonuclease YncB( thermonuclease family)